MTKRVTGVCVLFSFLSPDLNRIHLEFMNACQRSGAQKEPFRFCVDLRCM